MAFYATLTKKIAPLAIFCLSARNFSGYAYRPAETHRVPDAMFPLPDQSLTEGTAFAAAASPLLAGLLLLGLVLLIRTPSGAAMERARR
ncbi:MAG TPA: hypothetical protein DDZ68_09815 [Parvularcula sp.]|nr:hypothetical protein [Parvularcula sp.]HBS30392.1 hypothetical protein [Parvularcula sp.]HBS35772.1 hypothetical protein [Parvularcula sp.]